MDDYSINQVKKALGKTSRFKIKNSEELDKCIEHIFNLIKDSFTLYNSESYASSFFISVTIIEEVAKTSLALFITYDSETKNGRDPLMNHSVKHKVGTNYTIKMGKRLNDAIGDEMIEHIFQEANSGKLKELREASLYCDMNSNKLQTPEEAISKLMSKSLLLFAIESFDDNLVGYSNYSMEVSRITDELFTSIAKTD